jgi:hypothetical protein
MLDGMHRSLLRSFLNLLESLLTGSIRDGPEVSKVKKNGTLGREFSAAVKQSTALSYSSSP